MPVTLPMQGTAPIQIVLTTEYTLTKIKGSKAYFDIVQQYAPAPGTDGEAVRLSGAGKGKMTYDSKLLQLLALKTESEMDMSVKSGDKVSMIKTKTSSDITTTVTPVK